jgi:Flp pilus assembly secretin CpaC
MRVAAFSIALVVLASAPAAAQSAASDAHVSVTARIVVLDHEAITRAGVRYAAAGGGRVRVETGDPRRLPAALRARVGSGALGVEAFLDAARRSRWVRSESTQQVLALSGARARLSSLSLDAGPYASRSRGPSLDVTPTVLAEGRVHLRVHARVEDTAVDPWGYAADGSPVDAGTELVVRDGEEAVLATSAASESARDAGLLRLGRADRRREVLVVIIPRIVPDAP